VTTAWFVVPGGIDDPERVSGGNVYDRHVRDGLRRRGWGLRMCAPADRAELVTSLAEVAIGERVMIDGLVAGWDAAAVEALAAGARVIVLAHMVAAAFPGAASEVVEAERRVLAAAERVIATSPWTADELIRRGLVESRRLFVAAPGSRPAIAPLRPSTHHELLCVGVIAPHKGHDILLDALSRLTDDDWVCTVAGSSSADPDFAASIAAGTARFDGRVRLTGVLVGAELDAAYRRAGLLVAPSRVESFGMAIADAQRLGLPVIASDVGGIPQTVAAGGAILVAPDDPVALAEALQHWMSDPALRARLRDEAAHARSSAPRWTDTVARVDEILAAA
jgi:hypothetical protein